MLICKFKMILASRNPENHSIKSSVILERSQNLKPQTQAIHFTDTMKIIRRARDS